MTKHLFVQFLHLSTNRAEQNPVDVQGVISSLKTTRFLNTTQQLIIGGGY